MLLNYLYTQFREETDFAQAINTSPPASISFERLMTNANAIQQSNCCYLQRRRFWGLTLVLPLCSGPIDFL